MKLLNDLKLQFEKELWALSPELAVMDTILNQQPEIYEMVKKEGHNHGEEGSSFGRQDKPTVEQIVREGRDSSRYSEQEICKRRDYRRRS